MQFWPKNRYPGLAECQSSKNHHIFNALFLLLLVVCLHSSASAYPQQISVSEHNISVEDLFRKIEQKSGYLFVYRTEWLKGMAHININLKNTSIEKVLDKCFKGKGLTYTIIGNDIVISKVAAEVPVKPMMPVLPNLIHLRGHILDSTSHSPLGGVTIQVKGTTNGTTTDLNGAFSLDAPENSTLEVSYLGYNSQQIHVGQRSQITILLGSASTALSQLVVIGYGKQSKVTMTGAVSTVSMSNLKQAPVSNFSNTLAGKLPGVVTVNNSGEPGEDNSTILIRGNHSLNNNAPLIVIDGVPNRGGGLDRLNPNDIESITVLKDATASIYGSESANGVILITTKHGGRNQAAEFTLNFNQGFNQPTRLPKMANAPTYMTMLNEAALYQGLPAAFPQKDIDAYSKANRNQWLYPSTNWFKAALKTLSPQTNADISVQGGTDKLTYFVSLGALTQDGYYKNSATKYQQANFRSNISDQVTKNIKLSFDLSGRKEDRNFPTVAASQTFRMLIRGRPMDPAYYPNGLPGPDQENGVQPVVTGTTQTGFDHNQQYYLTGDVGLQITIPGLKGFNLQGHFSYNKEFQYIKNWQKSWTLYSFDKQGYINNGEKDPAQFLTPAQRGPTDPRLTETYYQQQNVLENLVANYAHSFGSHDITLMVGTEQQRFQDATFDAFRRHFISTSLPELFAGGQADWTNNGSAAHGARASFFSRANYDYKGKYLFSFVGRYDGSYLFPSNKRFGFFPAFSAGWRVSQEPFFKDNVSALSELKLRASWGRTGNDITSPSNLVEAQQYLGGYQFGNGYVFGIDQVVPGIYQSRVANPEVTWENSNQFDVGIDANAFDEKLSFTLDYWNELRTGILIQRNASVPQSTGLTLPKENLGKVRSGGFDGSIGWDQQLKKDASFHITLNGGYSATKIVFWDEPPGAPSYQKSTGRAINTALYYKVTGVFQTQQDVDKTVHWPGARPGDLIFADVNGDGKIDANDRIRINKSHTPVWTGGIMLAGTWKQFSLNVFFQGSAGAVQYVSTESGDIGNYFADFAKKRWIPDPSDPTGKTPDPGGSPYSGPRTFDRTDAYWSPQGSNDNTYFLRSTDYIRLKTLELGYSLPTALLKKLGGIQRLRVYVNGYNLLTWDKFKLMDPEASNAAGDYYPQTRVINAGFSLTF